jgi:hypothetical protein
LEIAEKKDYMTIEKLRQAQISKKVGVLVKPKKEQYINVIVKNNLKNT